MPPHQEAGHFKCIRHSTVCFNFFVSVDSVNHNNDGEAADDETSNEVTSTRDYNPIGRLQELTQKRRWPPPIYECTNECGPAHSREYVVTIHLLKFTKQGTKMVLYNTCIFLLHVVAALVEHLTPMWSVLGSIPIGGTQLPQL